MRRHSKKTVDVSCRRLLSVLLMVVGVLMGPSLRALGLGDMTANAQVGQPFSAEIAIVGNVLDTDALQVRRVYGQEAETLGYEPVGGQYPLRLNILVRDGRAVIAVSSPLTLNEPYIEFIIELTWPTGNVLRQYLVLPREPSINVSQEKEDYVWQGQPRPFASSPTSRALTTDSSRHSSVRAVVGAQSSSYVVQSGDALSSIAAQWLENNQANSASIADVTHWLHQQNRHAFINGDINRVMAGAKLQLPKANLVLNNVTKLLPKTAQTDLKSELGYNPGTESVTSNAITPNNPQGRLVVNRDNGPSLTEQLTSVDTLKTQIDIAKEEIARLNRENASLRERLDKLESGEIEGLMAQLLALQQSQIEQLKQSENRATQNNSVAPSNESAALTQESVQTEVALPVHTESAEPSHSILYWLTAGAAILAMLTWLFSRRRSRPRDLNNQSRYPYPDQPKKEEASVTQPRSEQQAASTENTASGTHQLSGNAANERAVALSWASELGGQHHNNDDKTEVENCDSKLAGATPIGSSELSAFSQLDSDNRSKGIEQAWIRRQFGGTDEELIGEDTEEELAESGSIDDLDIDPYNKLDNLDMMKPREGEQITPEFELDESLMGEGIEEDDHDDTLADDLFHDVSLRDLEHEFDISASNQAEDGSPEQVSQSKKELDVFISEVEMYLQLGQRDKAKRLLELVVLKHIDNSEDDPRIKDLLARCHLNPASGTG